MYQLHSVERLDVHVPKDALDVELDEVRHADADVEQQHRHVHQCASLRHGACLRDGHVEVN